MAAWKGFAPGAEGEKRVALGCGRPHRDRAVLASDAQPPRHTSDQGP